MSIRTIKGFRECGGCGAYRRSMSTPDTDKGDGLCLARPAWDPDSKQFEYPLVLSSLPDGFDQLNPWSPQNDQNQVGGCFPPVGVPAVEWDDVRDDPDEYTSVHDLTDA